MRVRVYRGRNNFRFTATAWILGQTRFIQQLCRFTAELVKQAVRHKQRVRQVNLDSARVVNRLPQLRHAILQAVKRFFCVVCHLEQAIQRMRHADAVFTGHGQNQLFFPAAKLDIHRDTTLAGGFQQRLLPVMIEVTVKWRVRTRLIEIGRHFIRPYAIAIFTGFFDRISPEAHHFTLNHHVQAIAIRQRLRHFNIKMIFRHLQHFTDR